MKLFKHVKVPGKLILSGEHAVVYDRPAIAMAISRFVQASVKPQDANAIVFNFPDFNYYHVMTLQELSVLKNKLLSRYELFLRDNYDVCKILDGFFTLAHFAVINFIEQMDLCVQEGLNITIHSQLSPGSGLGSSAAVVLSITRALALYYGIDCNTEAYLRLTNEAEKLQHGYPSGMDAYVSLHGNCWYFTKTERKKCELPLLPMFMVNSGKPASGTGESVAVVATKFKHSNIWDEFATTTQKLYVALQKHNINNIQKLLRENHRLLVEIGVVPQTVQKFIHTIEQAGAAAKICGAGAVKGERGGMILVIAKKVEAIRQLCMQYGYQLEPVKIAVRGMRVV
jgi:mevalonate kinase